MSKPWESVSSSGADGQELGYELQDRRYRR